MAQVVRFGSSGPPLLINPLSIVEPSADLFRSEYESATSRELIRVAGRNPDVDIGTSPEDIWTVGGLYSGWLTVPERLRAISTSAEDRVGGLGAQSILLRPHNPDFTLVSEADAIELPMNGLGLTALTDDTWIRCMFADCKEPAAYANGSTTGSNIGDITIQTESGIIVAQIPAGASTVKMSHFTVPALASFWLQDVHFSVSDQKASTFSMFYRQNADILSPPSPRVELLNYAGQVGTVDLTFDYKLHFPAKTDIWMRASAGTNDSFVTGEYFGLLLRNE